MLKPYTATVQRLRCRNWRWCDPVKQEFEFHAFFYWRPFSVPGSIQDPIWPFIVGSLISSDLWQFSQFFLVCHDLDVFEECWSVISENGPHFGLSGFPMFKMSICVFGKNDGILAGGSCCQQALRLVTLTLSPWFKLCACQLSPL